MSLDLENCACLHLSTSSHVASVDLVYLLVWTIDPAIRAYLFLKAVFKLLNPFLDDLWKNNLYTLRE